MDKPTQGASASGPAAQPRQSSFTEGEPQSAADAFHRAAGDVRELRNYAAHYVAAQLDRLKLSIRNLVLMVIVGVLGLVAAAAVVVTAIAYLIGGIARGLGEWWGMPWLGDLATGLGIVLILGLGLWLFISSMTRASRKRTVEKYERRRNQQRSEFGHDIGDRAGP